MIGSLLKAVAYSKAPRTTFTMLHPAKAVQLRKFKRDLRHAHAPRVLALGAAAVALPLGMWLGRKCADRKDKTNQHEGRNQKNLDVTLESVSASGSVEFTSGPMRAGARRDSMDQVTARI